VLIRRGGATAREPNAVRGESPLGHPQTGAAPSPTATSHARVAIVIVSFDNGDYLAATLDSVFAKTAHPRLEVIVVDNGSGPGVLGELASRATLEPRLTVIHNDANLGFARATNIGIAAAKEPHHVVLLNDDVIVTPGWLDGLLRPLEDPTVGLVGPVSNHVRGEARVELAYGGLEQLDDAAARNAREQAGALLEVPVLALFCAAARADTLARIGPLEERFTVGMYEDDDYSLRLRRAGYRLLCARDVFVHHWGGVSFRRLDEQTHLLIHETHRRLFDELWGPRAELLSSARRAARASTEPDPPGEPQTPPTGVAERPPNPTADPPRASAGLSAELALRLFAAHLADRFGCPRVPLARLGDELGPLLATHPVVLLEGPEPSLLRRVVRAAGGSDLFAGRAGDAALAIAVPRPLALAAPADFHVRAYVPVFNEADILPATLDHLLEQGVSVHVLDNWSTDGSWELVCGRADESAITAERFPASGPARVYEWVRLLERIEELAAAATADWLMLVDADELRVSPWPQIKLRDALWAVDDAGFTAVDHTVLLFPPVAESFAPGGDPREHFPYAELWRGAGYAPQIKSWKRGRRPVRLARSGGHEAEFVGRRVFPFNFVDEHYPLRSQQHAERKIFVERLPRFQPAERARGWHVQYDALAAGHRFLRAPGELERYDSERFVEEHLLETLARIGVGAAAGPPAAPTLPGTRARVPAKAASSDGTISVVYTTHRREPHFEWFADALSEQIGRDAVEVVVVDGLYADDRTETFERAAAGRFRLIHAPAKPSPYNGPWRTTRGEYFAPASARNTGIVHASGRYTAFIDDLSLPMPLWWRAVCEAAREGYVVAGAYEKRRGMLVRDGRLLASRPDPDGRDTRWPQGRDGEPVQIGGGALYGCSFGAPRQLLLEVDGFDELCDAIGGEDGQLGFRIEHAGARLWYDRRMLTAESVEGHSGAPALARADKVAHPAIYMARLRELGVSERSVPGRWDCTHMIFDLVHGRRCVSSLGNYYRLRELDAGSLESLPACFPTHHWFDQQDLVEM
jgi:GT2 family glycosyltransferase